MPRVRQKKKTHHSLYHELLFIMADPTTGCPVCHLGLAAVEHYLDDLLYERVTDVDLREQVRRSGGFCNDHSWDLRRLGGALGTAIMYRDVLKNLSDPLGDLSTQPRRGLFPAHREHGGGLRGLLAGNEARRRHTARVHRDPHPRCPACFVRAGREEVVIQEILIHLPEDEFRRAYTAAGGVCLVHVEQAAGMSGDTPAVRAMIAQAQQSVAALMAELDDFVRKHDYRFSDESVGDESTAWIRAIELIAGKERIR